MNIFDSLWDGEDRGVSEMMAVGTLIGLVLMLVIGIGINVFLLAPGADGPPDASFSFRYIEQSDALMVTLEEGDTVRAGDIYVEGDGGNATWAGLAGSNASAEVTPGAIVQVAEGGAYGSSIGPNDRIDVVWRNATANQTAVLASWNGESDV